jgi:hypothetical protein
VSEPTIVCRPRENTTSESELNALAIVYGFVLDCCERKEASRPGGPDDRERDLMRSRPRPAYHSRLTRRAT